MVAFDEVQFPTGVSYGSSGGPERRTEITRLGSGAVETNQVWEDSLQKFNAGYGVKSHDDLHDVIAFWEARAGPARGFRFKWWADFKSCRPLQTISPTDQALGTGDGSTAAFQLKKAYTSGGRTWTRTIKKPVTGSVRVAVAGVEKTITTHFTVDTVTGIVTFTGGNIPTAGQAVTAGFEFDVPVQFDGDFLEINLSAFEAGEIVNIPIVELRI